MVIMVIIAILYPPLAQRKWGSKTTVIIITAILYPPREV